MVNGYIPTTLQEALDIRASRNVIPYAGGTDLMVEDHREGEYLFLSGLKELRQIVQDGDQLRIGACCTFTELIEHSLTPSILKDAAQQIAAPAIRNEGTIGGNLGNGSAKADSALIFFVADASVKLASASGERVLPVREFYLGRKKLALRPDELITEVLLPTRWLASYDYQKVGARKALAISRVAFAGLMTVADGKVAHCATAFGAVSDTIIRRADIDAMLTGLTVEQAKAMKPAYLAAYNEAIQPTRGRVSTEYRKAVCMNLLRNYLETFGI